MIKISNISCNDSRGMFGKDTYGYFSIGCIEISSQGGIDISTYFLGASPFSRLECICNMDEECFGIILYRIGITNKYIVLSDFSNIPDIAVINNEEVLEALKSELIEYFNEFDKKAELFLSVSGDIDDKGQWTSSGNITWGPYIPQITSPVIGNFDHISDKYVTFNSTSTISSAPSKVY